MTKHRPTYYRAEIDIAAPVLSNEDRRRMFIALESRLGPVHGDSGIHWTPHTTRLVLGVVALDARTLQDAATVVQSAARAVLPGIAAHTLVNVTVSLA